MSDAPMDTWCRWLASLPPEVADELARMIAGMLPGAPSTPDPNPALGLMTHLQGARLSPRREAGLVLSLSAITDVVAAAQADPDTWIEARAMLEVLDQAAGEVLGTDVGEFVERQKLRAPLISRQWKAAATAWQTTRADALSPAAITRWMRRKRNDSLNLKP